jgi:hypothetical protein
MTDIVLRDVDAGLADRIRRIADAHGWDMPRTLSRLLELGLQAVDRDGAVALADNEASVLEAALKALEQVPSDPGFALIGRAEPLPPPPEEPDQSVVPLFGLE